MGKGVLSAMVVGVARGILVILSEGKIVDTLIHGMAELLNQGLPLREFPWECFFSRR